MALGDGAGPPSRDTDAVDLGASQPYARLPRRLSLRRLTVAALAVALMAAATSTLAAGKFSAADWRDLVIFGIAQGSLYALIAMGYTLVYGILLMINFAHGEVFMAGAFGTLHVAVLLESTGFTRANPLVSAALLLVLAMLISLSVALALERFAYRPLRRSPRLVLLITAIGASLLLQYSFRGLFGANVRAYPAIAGLDGVFEIGGIPILKSQAVAISAAAVLMVALYLLITRTQIGRAMRAVGEDREIASVMGINVDRVIAFTFALGGALAGAASVLWVMVFKAVSFDMGFLPGIKAFTAAVLGGIGNVVGAALGGLILGLLEAVGPFLLLTGLGVPSPNQLRDVIAFAILILVLTLRPAGLLGVESRERF